MPILTFLHHPTKKVFSSQFQFSSITSSRFSELQRKYPFIPSKTGGFIFLPWTYIATGGHGVYSKEKNFWDKLENEEVFFHTTESVCVQFRLFIHIIYNQDN